MSCKAFWEYGQASLSLVIGQESPCLYLALWELRRLLQHEALGCLTILNLWNYQRLLQIGQLLEPVCQEKWTSLYRWRKGSLDPSNHGIDSIIKEASMRGGKPLPLYGNPYPTHPTEDRFIPGIC